MPDMEKVINDLSTALVQMHGPGRYTPEDVDELEKAGWQALKLLELLREKEDDKPKGYWMPYEPDKRGYTDGFTCTRCERVILSDHYCKMIDFDFCPYCGAYMDNAEGL